MGLGSNREESVRDLILECGVRTATFYGGGKCERDKESLEKDPVGRGRRSSGSFCFLAYVFLLSKTPHSTS
jgi:hypothetical protein